MFTKEIENLYSCEFQDNKNRKIRVGVISRVKMPTLYAELALDIDDVLAVRIGGNNAYISDSKQTLSQITEAKDCISFIKEADGELESFDCQLEIAIAWDSKHIAKTAQLVVKINQECYIDVMFSAYGDHIKTDRIDELVALVQRDKPEPL